MNHTLTPSLLDLDGRLIESYQRITQATAQVKTELGLPLDTEIKANIALASVEEFIVLQTGAIANNDVRTWNLSRIGQDVKIESVFIDSPNADALTFEILKERNKIFTFNLNRNKTPYDFPENPLAPDLTISIKAKTNINFLRIVLKPVVILETLLADEDEPNRIIIET